MARTKKPRRPNIRKYKSYDHEAMQKALQAVRNGDSFKATAQRYGINRTTLMNHFKGFKCKAVGHPTVLTYEEEEMLVHTLVKLGVQDYVQKLDRPNPFRNGMQGIDWCMMFEKRWSKEISRRVAQNLPKNRAVAGSREVMEDCYNKLQAVYSHFGLDKKPQNIFNCDEIGFQTDAGVQKVLCKRGSRNPNKLVGSVTKATYTVLICCNAVGDFLPMFINYKGLHLYSTWCVDGPENCRYNCSPSGWMESLQFFDWYTNCFIPSTSDLQGTKLLIFDGHNSHLSLDLVETAAKHNIEIFCLPDHTSYLVQPLDVGVYKSVKASWKKILRDFYQESCYKNVDKIVFPSLMKKLANTPSLSRSNAVGGFDGSGIYPLSLEKMTKKSQMAHIVNGEDSAQMPSTSSGDSGENGQLRRHLTT
ncbi:uncharacterized protein LOC108916364 [Anoplophora glabripennis]|uniref:uncharacterized protein LOC108916364 n=1 Tax=Anoplophora glabripennis TaxID=217634 RepID=UPI000874FDB7|nr:uncharacterized protein LOC108916364 [Anoplophora glabripennis]